MNFASGGFLVIQLLALFGGGDSCSSISGPAGEFACISISRYSGKQYATCLTNTYIKLKSGNRHVCSDPSATYCYYQCMIEMHDSNSGAVSPDCSCSDSTGVTPTAYTGTTLPPYCYSPSGADCTWYADCLERKFACGPQTGYALTFGKKYCDLYNANYASFAKQTQQWVDAVRKCLQVALVPLMRQFNNPTCNEVKVTAIASHTGCYMSPAPGQPSICDVAINNFPDILKILFTIKGAFIELDATVLMGTWKSTGEVLVSCGVKTAESVFQFVIRSITSGRIGRSVGSDEPGDIAARFTMALSDSLGWKALGIDWIPLTSNYTQTGAIEFKLLVGDQRALNLNSNFSQPINMTVEMEKLKTKVQNGEVLFRLSDGGQFYARQLSECINSNCSVVRSTATAPIEPATSPIEPVTSEREPKSAEVTLQRLELVTMVLGLVHVFIARC